MAIGVQTDMATPSLAAHGSDRVREEFLGPSVRGDLVACLGVSEVGAGSDVASVKTTARKVGDDYVINGGKMWTTNGTQAGMEDPQTKCFLRNRSHSPTPSSLHRLDVPPRKHEQRQRAQEQDADLRAHECQG